MPTIKLLKKQSRTKRPDPVKRQDRIKIYQTKRWKRLRAIKIVESPICEECWRRYGRVEEAVDVHHRISFMSTDDPLERERLAFDYDNLMSLCKKCHQRIHNEYGKDKD